MIVIEEAGACRARHAEQLSAHLPAAAAAAQALLGYLHPKMEAVHRQLVALQVDVPKARLCHDQAVLLKEQSAREFAADNYAASFQSARVAQRNYRQMLWEYRAYAERFKAYVATDMQLYLTVPYGLPRYFASFDHRAVTPK